MGKRRNRKNIALSCVANNQNKLTFTVCVPVFFLKCSGLVCYSVLTFIFILIFCKLLLFFIATLLTKIRGYFYFFIFPI